MLKISAAVENAVMELGGMPADIGRAKQRAARQLRRRLESRAVKHLAAKLGTTQRAWRQGNARGRGKRVFVSATKAGGLRAWVGTDPMLLHYLGRLKQTRKMPGVLLTRRAGMGSQMFYEAFLMDSPYRRRRLAMIRQTKKPAADCAGGDGRRDDRPGSDGSAEGFEHRSGCRVAKSRDRCAAG
jgi:hypothetical protein